jgi:molybdopterin biosynthesis enzyme MoaB
MVNRTLVVSLPGSPGAVTECLGIIAGFLADAVLKIKKQGYGG